VSSGEIGRLRPLYKYRVVNSWLFYDREKNWSFLMNFDQLVRNPLSVMLSVSGNNTDLLLISFTFFSFFFFFFRMLLKCKYSLVYTSFQKFGVSKLKINK